MVECRHGIWGWLADNSFNLLGALVSSAGTHGERFVGTVIEETTYNVVFESELAGRLTFPRSKIRELQRTSPGAASPPWN